MRSFVQSRNTLRDPPPSLHNERRFWAVICPLGGCTPPVQSLTKQNFSKLRRQPFSKMFFGGICAALFTNIWRSRIAPPFTLSYLSAACAGMPYFLRRNYNRRKAKAALLLLTPRSTLKRHSYAETTFQNDFFIDKPHITQLPRLKANGRMSPPYAAIPPCFFRITRRLFSRQHTRLYAISAKLCRNLYFCGRIYINNLTNFPFVI